MSAIQFTVYTEPNGKTAGKTISIKDGRLTKTSNAHGGFGYRFTTETVSRAKQFADFLNRLPTSCMTSYGIAKKSTGTITSARRQDQHPDRVARNKGNFRWPDGAGILMLDYDAPEDGQGLTKGDLITALTGQIKQSAYSYVHGYSSSSFIYDAAGRQWTGARGQRLYLFIKQASDAKRALDNLHERLWLSGFGRFDISKSGSLLSRSLVDISVAQPERLDYSAPPQCLNGLVQKRPPFTAHGSGLLDSQQALPDLTPDERSQLDAMQQEARKAVESEAQAVRKAFDEKRGKIIREQNPALTQEQAERIVSTARCGVLQADFVLFPTGDAVPAQVTVKELLSNPQAWHGQYFREPLEPGYRSDNPRMAMAVMFGKQAPMITSLAHGGIQYKLGDNVKSTHENKGSSTEEKSAPGGFESDKGGVFEVRKDKDGQPVKKQITYKPVSVKAISRNHEGENWGVLVHWEDMDGKEHERAIPKKLFHANGTELACLLADGGLPIKPGQERKLLQFLAAFKTTARMKAADCTGWLEKSFVLPDKTINETESERIVFQPAGLSNISKAITTKGTHAEWMKGIENATPLAIFCISAALSAPIRYLVGVEAGGFHLFNTTSKGKTTVLQAAASVWGNGTDPQISGGDSAYIQRWNSTTNALESKAEAFNDLPMIVDEIGEGDPREFG
ncbi:MAG: DUF927 domain-containing protein [gamma proteobacterium symbiont of Bathyaustriella thionipta]|nr:DUF927 domain-containing protein [gamma proteobacterium symbiont of Bathyaustriella thionipta]